MDGSGEAFPERWVAWYTRHDVSVLVRPAAISVRVDFTPKSPDSEFCVVVVWKYMYGFRQHTVAGYGRLVECLGNSRKECGW